MITKVQSTISNLKNLWIELFIDKTNKVTNVADGSILNATAYGTAKVAQKAIKDIAIVESQIFPESATGALLDKSAALFGVSPRKGALGSSTYIRVLASPGTIYGLSTYFIAKNGTRFIVDKELIVDESGYGYVSVRSTVTGSSSNVEANSITQVTPRPLTHIECINEYQAVGGRDYEDDETFRTRIKNNDNKLSKGTVEYWTQVFQDIDPRVLRVMNVGLGEDAKTHIYLVTQNGSFFTEDELSTLLAKASSYFGLFEIDLAGNSIGIVLENAEWMYIGGAVGVDFRVELTPGADVTTVRKNIQIALTKYLDFRFWSPGKTVQWDDLLQVVKTATGVKYVPDEFFNPFYDETVPLNQLPRIKGFLMRDLNGSVLFDSGSVLSNIFYPAGDSNIYTGQQSQALSQTQIVQVTVTNVRGASVDGAVFSVGSKIVITNSEGRARLLLENGEYDYVLSKNGWTEQTGNFIVLNAEVFIVINDFTAALQLISFEILQISVPIRDVQIAISNQTLETDINGQAQISLEPGTYSYSLTKTGLAPVLNAVIVERSPISIVEYMFPQAQPVFFSVIDRERNVYVPGASVWVQDVTEETNDNGQAEFLLSAGTYELTVQRPRYLQYKKTINISDIEKNCVLVELEATPYQVNFTVLALETSLPIDSASIAIHGGIYKTNNQGIAIVSLADGSYPFEVVRSGYSQYSGVILVDGEETGVVIRMNKAFWKTTFIVRDIDSGIFLQGALTNINDKSALTDVNGESEFLLSNGDYSYNVSLAEYRTAIGEVNILDQDTEVTVFMRPKGRMISFIVKDSFTKEVLLGVQIPIADSGTGIVIATLNTNSEGKAVGEFDRGNYMYTASKERYFDKEGTFEVDLVDFEIEVLMELKPVNLKITTYTENDAINKQGIAVNSTVSFTSKTTGDVIISPPATIRDDVSILIKPGLYDCVISGPGITTKEELNIEVRPIESLTQYFNVRLNKEITIYLYCLINPTDTESEWFWFTENAEVALYRTQQGYAFKEAMTVNDGLNTRIRWQTSYFNFSPTYYNFILYSNFSAPTQGTLIFYKYYDSSSTILSFNVNTPDSVSARVFCKKTGFIRIILQDTTGQYLPVGEKFTMTITRIVTGDFPYTKTEELTSINRDGIVLIESSTNFYGEYQIKLIPIGGKYSPSDIFIGEMSNQNTGLFSTTLRLKRAPITVGALVKYYGFPCDAANTRIIKRNSIDVLAGPINTNAEGLATFTLEPLPAGGRVSVGSELSFWYNTLQNIELQENQTIEIELESRLTKRVSAVANLAVPTNLKFSLEDSTTSMFVDWGDGEHYSRSETSINKEQVITKPGSHNISIYTLGYPKTLIFQNSHLIALDLDLMSLITNLQCGTNELTSLDLGKLINLTYLYCNNNLLTELDLTKNPKLSTLLCSTNNLTSLDLTNNTALNVVDCNVNKLTSLDTTTLPLLLNLQCGNNPLITELDLTKNPKLANLQCPNLGVKTLNLEHNLNLSVLNCTSTKLTHISMQNNRLKSFRPLCSALVSVRILNNLSITSIDVNKSSLTELDLSGTTEVTRLLCSDNNLTSLNIQSLVKLKEFNCANNKLTSLDLSGLSVLEIVNARSNANLSSIKILSNEGLIKLDLSLTRISSINFSECVNLENLDIISTGIASLDLSKNPKINTINISDTPFSSSSVGTAELFLDGLPDRTGLYRGNIYGASNVWKNTTSLVALFEAKNWLLS